MSYLESPYSTTSMMKMINFLYWENIFLYSLKLALHMVLVIGGTPKHPLWPTFELAVISYITMYIVNFACFVVSIQFCSYILSIFGNVYQTHLQHKHSRYQHVHTGYNFMTLPTNASDPSNSNSRLDSPSCDRNIKQPSYIHYFTIELIVCPYSEVMS